MPPAVSIRPVAEPVPPPTRIGKYVLVKEVGQGSTGVVYLSHDPYYGRDVAIKIYKSSAGVEPEQAVLWRKMFLSEAHMVGLLQHPNILPIYDAGEEDDRCYVVTEHIHGARTLANYCRKDHLLRVDAVVELMFKCAKALHYAHSRSVVHRDIKPSNLMLTHDGDVRIIDFGIALAPGSEDWRIDGVAGSPSYMSPEQVQGHALGPASDLYSLGAVMYELLTGSRPFRASNLGKLLHKIVYSTPPPIHTVRPEVPEELEAVVAMAMQKDPSRRFRSGLDFAAALTRVHQKLRTRSDDLEASEHFKVLRLLTFFHDFSHGEIHEVLRASAWREYVSGEEIVKEGEIDDRFYVVVAGKCRVERYGVRVGNLDAGDCFGETSYVPGAKRNATVRAAEPVIVLRVSATLLEQASEACQLRFNKMFLRSLIGRLQGAERSVAS